MNSGLKNSESALIAFSCVCSDRLFLGDAFSQCAAGYCGPREYRRLFRAG